MARIIVAMSTLEGLQTLQSCEGTGPDSEAYVYFWYRSWSEIGELIFTRLLPCLEKRGISATGSIEVFNGSPPTGKIAFSAEALEQATSALEGLLLPG